VPSGKSETPRAPTSAPGHRLRRDALRILAEKFEGRTLSSTGAENLLAKYETLEGSLRAVRRLRTQGRRSGQFSVREILGTEIGILQLRWMVRVVAVLQLCLVAMFLVRIGFSTDLGVWMRHLQVNLGFCLTTVAIIVWTLSPTRWRGSATGRRTELVSAVLTALVIVSGCVIAWRMPGDVVPRNAWTLPVDPLAMLYLIASAFALLLLAFWVRSGRAARDARRRELRRQSSAENQTG